MVDVILVIGGALLMMYTTMLYANLLFYMKSAKSIPYARAVLFLLPFIGAIMMYIGLS